MEHLAERYNKIPTSIISDVLEQFGLFDQALDLEIRPVRPGRIAGPAYTVQGEMREYTGTGDSLKMEACSNLPDGSVMIWRGQGRGICYFGDLIFESIVAQNCKGIIVDGGVRDVADIQEKEVPVYAKYITPVQSIGRWKVTSYQKQLYMDSALGGHVEVNPEDYIVADPDGIVVIPKDLRLEILTKAETILAVEDETRESLIGGMTLQAALDKYGHI